MLLPNLREKRRDLEDLPRFGKVDCKRGYGLSKGHSLYISLFQGRDERRSSMMWTISLILGPEDELCWPWPLLGPELRIWLLPGPDSSPAALDQDGI